MSGKRSSGVHIGDYAIQVTPAGGTCDRLDTEANRERARREEDDERVAQHFAGEPGDEAGEAAAQADVDASIAAAREKAAGGGGGDLPILLRDPITGAIIPQP
jgi:hypothetical protein